MKPVSAKRTYRTGGSVSSSQHFEAEFPAEPSVSDVAEAQIALGYHPGGYGGPLEIKVLERSADCVRVSWFCWASCD